MKLRPVTETDRAVRDHVETNHIYDPATDELWEPTEPPEIDGLHDDDDED